MTLGEGKKKAYELLDEYGTGGALDQDLETRIADHFDIAQKEIAKTAKIVKTVVMDEAGEAEMPEDFYALCGVWKNGRNVTRYRTWIAGRLLVMPGETVTVEYYAMPATIDEDTPDEWEFEVSEAACQAMPFFVAAQILSSDLVNDPSFYMQTYQMMVATLPQTPPGGAMRVRNSFYGGGRHG